MGSQKDTRNFNPFPGLRPFTPDESDLFFGRENESGEVVKKLLRNRFVTVIGASGTGKSSLIYCGVLPKVKQKVDQETAAWQFIMFRPGNDPFGNLGDAIADTLSANRSKKISIESILLDLHLNNDGIAFTLNKYLSGNNTKILLVVDQFEELFRYSTTSAGGDKGSQAAGFVSKLVSAVNSSVTEIFTIITMRSDYIGECAHYQGLTQLINNSNYLVPHMDRENYRQAIEGPVRYAGAAIDQKLTETMLEDIGDRTDQLPVLQHAMMRTWTHWQEFDESDRPLSNSDYESVGTMSDAMSRHANEAYEELDPRGREICEKMFKTITEKGSDNKGIRHPSSVSTIKSVIQCSSEELFAVVEKFRIPSRSFITPRQNIPLNDDSIIDLSHESLMRLWDRLRLWVDEETASVQMYLRLSEASAMFQQGKTSLWRPPDLQLAINWRDQHKPTLAWAQRYDTAFERAMAYLRTSEKEYLDEEEGKIRLQRRQMRRTRIIAMILGTAAIISVGFMLFAFVQKIAADRQTILAEVRKTEAEKQKSIADSTAVVATEARSEAVQNATLAEERAEEARREKENAERQRRIAVINEELAKQNEIMANLQKDSATWAKEQALINEQTAIREREEALRLRMLSIGKSMSVKSLQVQGQQDLQTLLAYQAYLFNANNRGLENDADIYNGLYNVAKQYGNVNYKSFKGHNGEIKSIAFVPGKNEFYTSGYDGKVLKWSTEGQSQTFQIVYSGTDIIDVLAVSPDASWLACGSGTSSIKMIPLKGNTIQYDLTGHKGKIKSLIFSFDGRYLYSAGLDGIVLKWDIAARTSKNVASGNVQITSIDISSKGDMLAGISSDGRVIVWDPEKNTDIFTIPTTGRNIKVIRFKPDKNIIALGDANGNVELWDIAGRNKISDVKAHNAQVNDIRFNQVYNQMATASNDKTLKLFNNLEDLTEPPITFTDNEGFVLVMQFSPDGQLIVSGAYDGTDNLIGRPTHVSLLVKDICTLVTRNMKQDEWNTYVGKDLPLEVTCKDQNYNIKVNVKK
jgi:WD40 repeat protein